jgi:hypothetical protein
MRPTWGSTQGQTDRLTVSHNVTLTLVLTAVVSKSSIFWEIKSCPFFNFALEHAIRQIQENQVGLKLNGTHQQLAYADHMNLLSGNMGTIKKDTESLTEASKDVGQK